MPTKNRGGEAVLDAKVRKYLFDVCVRVNVWGGRAGVSPPDLEPDKRKQKRVIRELAAAGYLSIDDGGFAVVTDKAWDETPAESVNLIAEWDEGRQPYQWNGRGRYPFILLDHLTPGQVKYLVRAGSEVIWRLAKRVAVNFGRPLQDGELSPPTTPGAGIQQTLRDMSANRHFATDFVVCVGSEFLATHACEVKEKEEFDCLFVQNLAWGLHKVVGIAESDADHFKASDDPDWIGGAAANLGTDPAKWGERLAERTAAARESLARKQGLLRVLEEVDRLVKEAGGWAEFGRAYAGELRAKLAERKGAADAAPKEDR